MQKASMWSAEKDSAARHKLILIAVFPHFLAWLCHRHNVLLMLLLFLPYIKCFTNDGWSGLSDVGLQQLSYASC